MDIRVKITRDKSNVVKTMDIEEYLRGVVPSEMSSTWPMEALKAQAVAARTYAMGHLNPARAYDVDDTVTYQAFHLGRTRKRSDEAIKATKGEVLTIVPMKISLVPLFVLLYCFFAILAFLLAILYCLFNFAS